MPKFTDDSANEWWKAARVVFLFTYPKPETVPEFAKLVRGRTKRRTPGRMKQAILDLLRRGLSASHPPRQLTQLEPVDRVRVPGLRVRA